MSRAAAHPYILMALNNAWANARFYSEVQRLGADDFIAPRPGFFPSLARTLNHIYEVDLYYLDALQAGGRGRSINVRTDILDPAALAAAQAKADIRLAAFCHDLTADTLAQRRATERAEGMVMERVDALLLHLFQHQVHHRGQAHVQLHHAGVAPPQLDDFYLDHDRHPTATEYHR